MITKERLEALRRDDDNASPHEMQEILSLALIGHMVASIQEKREGGSHARYVADRCDTHAEDWELGAELLAERQADDGTRFRNFAAERGRAFRAIAEALRRAGAHNRSKETE